MGGQDTPTDMTWRLTYFRADTTTVWSSHTTYIYRKGKDQPGKVANNPARGQLNGENEYFTVPAVRA